MYKNVSVGKRPVDELQEFLDLQLRERSGLKVLEAGCGSASHFRLNPDVALTGIDISQKQLERNRALKEAIVGDLQQYEFPKSSFDLIICWTVLEHLTNPELALGKFADAVKPGGLIVLGLPNVFSIKGMVTKWLPLSVHTLYYKYIFGRSNAGKDDTGPFKTYLRLAAAPGAIQRFAVASGLTVAFFRTYDAGNSAVWQRKGKVAKGFIWVYNCVRALVKFISLGQIGESEFIMVLSKPQGTNRQQLEQVGSTSKETE
jgi:SAM-dependent methyltransferase